MEKRKEVLAYDENHFEVGRLQIELTAAIIKSCRVKLATQGLDLDAHFDVKLDEELAAVGGADEPNYAAGLAIVEAAHQAKYKAERLQFEGMPATNLTNYIKLKPKYNKLKEYCNRRLQPISADCSEFCHVQRVMWTTVVLHSQLQLPTSTTTIIVPYVMRVATMAVERMLLFCRLRLLSGR